MKKAKFTIKHFQTQFPTDDACLQYIFNHKYGAIAKCPQCKEENCLYKVKTRRAYACSHCGYHLYPTAGTIFHKSSTSLRDWFFAIFLMSQSKNGVSAKEIERHLGVTYKTAWRMATHIRKLMCGSSSDPLSGTVEVDETYIGGKSEGTRGRGAKGKSPVFGMVERSGKIRAQVVNNLKAKTLLPIVQSNVAVGTRIISDDFLAYTNLVKQGYKHETVKHALKEYVDGDKHTNTLEGFWSQVKRSIDGTYHVVSPKYLQYYVSEFAYRYNYCKHPASMFDLLLREIR